ncbi:hypothetical protein DFH27DRAFT_479391 [Peziza echinospora]|nr:hypothetical protein DFH27DRAFT_479391 [Peziza echinospora]
MTRPESPLWDGVSSNSVPLLPVGRSSRGDDGKTYEQNMLSRSPSPYPFGTDQDGEGASMLGGGSRGGKVHGRWRSFSSWFKRGKLGWWLWNSQRGWAAFVTILIILNGGSGVLLLGQNQVLMRTGVYKFAYPITTTFLELVMVELLLIVTASLTRTFSYTLRSLGFPYIIAPDPTPSKDKQRAGSRQGAFATLGDWSPSGIFGLELSLAKKVLPLAIVYTSHLILSNVSFAYALRHIYQLSRVGVIPLTVIFTYFWSNQNPPLSVTTLSSTLTMTFAVAMVSIQSPFLFTWESVVAGSFSSIFAALYPIILHNTYKNVLRHSNIRQSEFEEAPVDQSNPVYFQGDGKAIARSHWKFLHYTNLLAIMLTLPWIYISGELGNIYRNCYILDTPWFWIMILADGSALFALFVFGWMLTKTTSPLTANMVGGVQVAVQSLILTGFNLPEWSWTGAVMIGVAAAWYFLGRRRECGVNFWGGGDEGSVVFDGDGEREDGILRRDSGEWVVGGGRE